MKESVYIIQCPPSWLKVPPLSLAYLENYLRHNGFTVKTKDLNAELFNFFGVPAKEWLSLDQNFESYLFQETQKKFTNVLGSLYAEMQKFEFIGISILKRNVSFSFLLAEKIKEMFPEKKIIFGGPHTLFLDWQNQLDSCYIWVIGEGEIALSRIMAGDKNTVYRFEEIKNLDTLPFLDFKPFAPKTYFPIAPLLSSRGCIHNCNFCSEKLLYKKFRHHSAQYVFEQIKYLKNKYRMNDFIFCDSMINYNNAWLSEFCSLIIKNNLAIKWQAQMRIDRNFSLELGRLMKESGCYNLFVGLESASDCVLKNMNKGFGSDTALDFFKKLNATKLQFEISLIFGYPGESGADFKKTLNFVVKNKKIIPKIAQANPFVDYLNSFPKEALANQSAKNRVRMFLSQIENEKITYTKSFINNLIYP